MTKGNGRLPRADYPEQVGVSSKKVLDFLSDMSEAGKEFHSFMVLRHGKVAAECFRAPFSADTPHQMYSVSKSFTSTAIGFAINEGLISLDTKLVDIFPDYVPENADERLYTITVEHLISMCAGINTNLLANKGKIDWIKDFMTSPFYGTPGVDFRYVNENIFMLCAMIFRVTGGNVRDYLEDRLFKPLDIDYPFWETDANGIEAGGWGIYVKTEDLAKLMLCYSNGGVYNGKQVIPEFWAKSAVKKHTDNTFNEGLDSCNGYGYCFWRNGGCKESYRADGMFSQFGIVFEELDAIFICTSAIASEQSARDYIWKYFPDVFDDTLTKDDTVDGFQEYLNNSKLEAPELSPRSTREIMLNGRRIKVRKKLLLNIIGFPMSILPLSVVYMASDRAGNIDNIVFNFQDSECEMYWTEGDEDNTVICGMDGHYRYGVIRLGQLDYKVCSNAVWLDNDTLSVNIRPIETVGKRKLRFEFKSNGRVNIYPTSTPVIQEIADTLVSGVSEIIKNPAVAKAAQLTLKMIVPKIVEPVHRGKIKD